MHIQRMRLGFDVLDRLIVLGLIVVIPVWHGGGMPYQWYYMGGLLFSMIQLALARGLSKSAQYERNETEGFLFLWSLLTVFIYLLVYSRKGMIEIGEEPIVGQVMAAIISLAFVGLGIWSIYVQQYEDIAIRGALAIFFSLGSIVALANVMPILSTYLYVCSALLLVELVVIVYTAIRSSSS